MQKQNFWARFHRKFHFSLEPLGICFDYKGDEIVWILPWKRSKYMSVLWNGLEFKSLRELDKFNQECNNELVLADDKLYVDADEFLRMLEYKKRINGVDLDDIVLYKNGKEVKITKKEIEDWKFIGFGTFTTLEIMLDDE